MQLVSISQPKSGEEALALAREVQKRRQRGYLIGDPGRSRVPATSAVAPPPARPATPIAPPEGLPDAVDALIAGVAPTFGVDPAQVVLDSGSNEQASRALLAVLGLCSQRLGMEPGEISWRFGVSLRAVLQAKEIVEAVADRGPYTRFADLTAITTAVRESMADREVVMRYTVTDIQRAVVKASGSNMEDIRSSRRTATIVMPRQIAMALVKRLTLKSLPEIGRQFGGRDHTTVLHGCRKYELVIQALEAEGAIRLPLQALAERAIYLARQRSHKSSYWSEILCMEVPL